MSTEALIETAKQRGTQARGQAGMIAAHARDVAVTGIEVLRSARDVVIGAHGEALALLARTADELRRTLREGVARVRGKLARIATPTHKEQALARKAQIKAKKRSRQTRAGQAATAA